jgi:hypothetical protein
MVQSNLAFEVVYDDALYKPLLYWFSNVPFSMYFGVSYSKSLKYQHMWNFLV